jgi:hypothetical protein
MKVQYENKVMSSLLLFIDHEVTQKGDAYTNHQSNFFKIDSLFSDYYVYASPYKQLVSDAGITGSSTPSLLTGVYVDGDGPIGPGTSGLHSINSMQGQVYFTGGDAGTDPMSSKTVSGRYAIKDFNVFLTSMPEEQLLFETKLVLNPKTSDIDVNNGVDPATQTYPAIFVKDNGGTNEEFALGGVDNTIINARAIVLADSLFNLDAVCGILKDSTRKSLNIIEQTDLNLNALGGYTGVTYDYTGVTTGDYCLIDEVRVSKNVANRGDFQNLNPNVFSAFVDFEIHNYRQPRA